MAESKFKNLQNEVCELPPEPPSSVKVCPTCTIDPDYVEPTWWETTDPYLNLSVCEYQVAILSSENPRNLSQAEINYLAQKSVKKGIRKILRQYSKLELDSVVCAFPPKRSSQVCRLYLPPELIIQLDEIESLSGQMKSDVDYNKQDPENRFNLEALEIKAFVKDIYYGDSFERFQILVSIPAEAIDVLVNAPFGDEEQDEIEVNTQTDKVVVLDGRAFKNNILQMKAIFKLYSRYQSLYYMLQRLSLLQDVGDTTKKFRLTKFPNLFEKFKDSLEELLEDNNYKLRRRKGVRTAHKIKIVFDKRDPTRPYLIKSIQAKYKGCPYKKLRGLGSFREKEEVKNQTLMHYISNLNDMLSEIENSSEPVPWLDFVADHTYPPLTIDFGSVDSTNEELDSCISDTYLSEIRDGLLEEALSFREMIEFTFSTRNCQTIEEYRNNNLVTKTKEKIKKEKLTKEQRTTRRKNRRIDKEAVKLEKQRIQSFITAREEQILNFDFSNPEALIQGYVDLEAVDDDLEIVKILKTEVKALKSIISNANRALSGLLLSVDERTSEVDLYEQATLRFVEEQQQILNLKQEELKELKRTQRHTKFPVTEALSSENLKRLWAEAKGPETEEPSLAKKLAARASTEGKAQRISKNAGRSLISKINPCSWEGVLFDVIECLLGGMSLAEAIPIIVKSTLSKTSPFVLQKVLQGLPPETQLEVEEKVKEELANISADAAAAFKTPWDAASEQAAKEELFDNTADRDKQLNDLSETVEIVFDAYVEAIIELAGIDRLVEMLDKIPGANVFKKVFLQAACPSVNNLTVGIDDLFGSLKIGFCEDGANGYILPEIPNLPSLRMIGVKGVINILLQEFREKIVELIDKLILILFVKVLELLDNSLCRSIGALGSLLANQISGQDTTRNGLLDAINDAFCNFDGNANDTQDDLLSRAGMPDSAKSSIANSISRAMSPNEIKQALLDCSSVPSRVWKAIYAIIQVTYPDLLEIINGPDDVKEIFCIMGSLLSPEQRGRLEDSFDTESPLANRPMDNSICLTNSERVAWDQRRIEFYQNDGLDSDAAEDFVNGLNDKMLSDLADLMDLLANGPEGVLEDLFGKAFEPSPDPECIESLNILPPPPEEIKQLQAQISEGIFGTLSSAFTRDMIGHRHAFIDNILADSRGKRLTGFLQHESRVGFDLLFPNAANSIEDHRDKYDQSGYITKAIMAQKLFPEDTFEGNQETEDGITTPEANHLFPDTISIYARKQLMDSTQEIEFTTGPDSPSFILNFKDISEKPEDYEFDKGFNLVYKNNTNSDDSFKRDGLYVIRKTDLNRIKDNNIQRTRDFRLRIPYGLENNSKLVQQIDSGENTLNQPYVNFLFSEYIKRTWSRAGVNNLQNTDTLYDKMNTGIAGPLIHSLLEDSREPDGIPTGFRFGYNNDKITYEDLLYVNPEATDDTDTWEYTYEEEDKTLGKSATGNKRVKFLDPAKYGGRYTKPKLYLEPTEHDGWYRVLQIVVPELDGCDPRRSDFLYLTEISDKVSSLQNTLPTDKRMELDESCTQEPAFDKLLSPSSTAYMEGVITATIRAYCSEAILRTMPMVSQLKLDFKRNYDDAFLSLIVEKMEEEMTEQGGIGDGFTFSRIKEYTYWLLFLEQVVQSSYRKVKEGTLPREPLLLSMLRDTNRISKNYLRPELEDIRLIRAIESYSLDFEGNIVAVQFKRNQSSQKAQNRGIRLLNALAFGAYGKDYRDTLLKKKKDERRVRIKVLSLKRLKTITREFDLHNSMMLSKSILRFHIRAELEGYSDKLDEFFVPQPYIFDLSKFFIGASNICKNHTIQAGLSEVERPVGESSLPYGDINEVVQDPSVQNPLEDLEITDEIKNNGVFFLEKYAVVTPKGTRSSSFTTLLNGVVSITELQSEIRNFRGDKEILISEALGDAIEVLDENGNVLTYDGSIGIKFGVRLCYAPPSNFAVPNAIEFDRAFKAKPVEGYAGSAHYFPIAKFEQDIIDRKLNEIDLQDTNLGEDLKCYVDKLVSTSEFDLVINNLLITRRISGLMSIYMYDAFIDSLGLDSSEREEGSENRGNQKWKGNILDDTKDQCRALFASFYRSMDSDDDSLDETKEKNRKKLFSNLLPNGLFNIDRSVKWWQLRRRLEDRPFNKDGEDCVNDLAEIFGG